MQIAINFTGLCGRTHPVQPPIHPTDDVLADASLSPAGHILQIVDVLVEGELSARNPINCRCRIVHQFELAADRLTRRIEGRPEQLPVYLTPTTAS